jgi:cellulose synthase/poly-beta-1,6-N-acetylglucosamine synthase-like glycosyltransferase
VFNEEANIRSTLESLLRLEYPRDKVQILVISDASTDMTEQIVAEFAGQGIELLRLPHRVGKTEAENAAIRHLEGEIIVNTDASVRVQPKALKALLAAFSDPTVGVASGYDLSTLEADCESNLGEMAYTGYEMGIRNLESRTGGIIGASGCLFASRAHLHQVCLPPQTFRDFAIPLIARERGLRSVSVPQALCSVPRVPAFRSEYRRKVRTMVRGMHTLRAYSSLLNPIRYGVFAWKLWSHKVCRWLLPWAVLMGLAALGCAAFYQSWARWVLASVTLTLLTALMGWFWPEGRGMPRLLALPAAAVAANAAALQSFIEVLSGEKSGVWEPTRRGSGHSRITRTTVN